MQPKGDDDGLVEYDLYNEADKRSLVSLLPAHMRDAIKALPSEYLQLTEDEIETKWRIKPIARIIRISFWKEYVSAQTQYGRPMSMTKVYSGVCSKQHFHNYIVAKPEHLLWVITPPVDFQLAMEEALYAGVKLMRQIFNAKPVMENGMIDSRAAEACIKAFALVRDIVKGPLTHKLQTTSVNLNVDTKARELKDLRPSDIRHVKPLEIKDVKSDDSDSGD